MPAVRRRVFGAGCLIGLVLWASLACEAGYAQVEPDTTNVEPDLERIFDDFEDEAGNPTALIEQLAILAEQPLDINAATAEDLAQIPWLGPVLAGRLVAYRAAHGLFGSIAEIRNVEGLTGEVFIQIRPYLTVDPKRAPASPRPSRFPAAPTIDQVIRGMRFDLIQRITRRLDLGRGYEDDTTRTTYRGSPERLYIRVRATYGRQASLNVTLEKDPGEAFTWDPSRTTYGYDHVTMHAAVRDMGRLRRFIVGDYSASFGQGLVLWTNSAFGKGREPVRPLVRNGTGLRPYGSTDENNFFRGTAAAVSLSPSIVLSSFVSRRRLDATVVEPDTTRPIQDERIRSLPDDGYHRTPSEIARKDAVRAALYGGALEYTRGATQVGAVGYHTRFGKPLEPADHPDLRYAFRGQDATLLSLFARSTIGDYGFFGEVARGPGDVIAGIGGLEFYVRDRAEALLLARIYPRDFTSLYGFAFGERNGTTQNETGFYTGLTVRVTPRWRISTYVDQYRFPWLRFGTPRPTTGYDALLLVEYTPHRWLSCYVQGRTETREERMTSVDAAGRQVEGVAPETRQSLRAQGQYHFSRDLRVRARAEVSRFSTPAEPSALGVLLFQDVRWQARPWLRLQARLAMFDVDRFDARIYTYEDDLLYAFSVPAFSGRGQRTYMLVHLTPLADLTLQMKYGSTTYEDVTSVGSGLDETPGNRLRELRAQLRYRF